MPKIPKGDPLGSQNVFFQTENQKNLEEVPFDGINIFEKNRRRRKNPKVSKIVSLFGLVYFCENQIKIVHPGIRTHTHTSLPYSRALVDYTTRGSHTTTIVGFFQRKEAI